MLKEALDDRFLQVSVIIFLIASVLFSYYVYEYSAIGLAFGQPLTDQQKTRAIAIALDNPIVRSEVWNIVPWPNGTYHIKGVLPSATFREVGPNIDRNRTLPAVEFVSGNESEKGQNVLAFVDLLQNRVAYVGHTKRADAYGQVPPEDYFNTSIAWTGYHDGQVLSDEQKAKAVRLALEDKAVQELMGGRSYSVMGDVIVTYCGVYKDNKSYTGAYPYVRFTQGTPMNQADAQVFVVVDIDRDEVIQSMVGVRTPIFDTPVNTT
jgi:hypothetical protein